MTLDLVSKKNPFLLVVLGEFSATLSHRHDKNSSTSEGISIENITLQFNLQQIINQPTHILENPSSRINLIFTSQPNLSVESGTKCSLDPNFHHQIIYIKFISNTPYLILKSFTHHLTLEKLGTIKIQMLILSDNPLMHLTGIQLLRINM